MKKGYNYRVYKDDLTFNLHKIHSSDKDFKVNLKLIDKALSYSK
jgi:hypothetical protein